MSSLLSCYSLLQTTYCLVRYLYINHTHHSLLCCVLSFILLQYKTKTLFINLMKTVHILIFCVSVLVNGVFLWEIDKTDPECQGRIKYPGIINVQGNSVIGGRKIENLLQACQCRLVGSGSIFPPKVSSLYCTAKDGKRYRLDGSKMVETKY
ncbi:hypothetical protein BDF20DRAFT_887933 [Mycotypha africana]|uniref:uncharacterized protein n=1 Tax=Mycotypha africana TaxID=64632 RepID=UPI0023015B5F|nr:uncharacterized protein BDF20DRAFT_887933 [Mycotypha africana]KAI8972011.1 hypothetical protein BDF20DRAFT_887933 [Mycotypha africana]